MMGEHDSYHLRDGQGPLPAELREPIADVMEAIEQWEWVGSDAVMDDLVGATRRLHEAARALREAVGQVIADGPAPTG